MLQASDESETLRMNMRQRSGLAVAFVAILAAIVSALAPLAHGLIHPDHAVLAAIAANKTPSPYHAPAHPPHQDTDCPLYQAYASPASHAAPPSFDLALHVPLEGAYTREIPPLSMPAGAPRGIALGRGPPLQS
jgi:hypothetical protein